MPPTGPKDPLETYRSKRTPSQTPEPFGPAAPGAGRSFVIQKHRARRLHFDLRLEWRGVLVSWAVPKGLSLDPADKHLAVHVEDHPLDYADFEGLIPEGNYGAGAVIVWDRGRYEAVEEFEEGFRKGKLLFDLHGQKLRGRWTLVKLRKTEKDWLVIKERDAYARAGVALREESVVSGLTVEELAAGGGGGDRAGPVRAALERLGAPRRDVGAEDVELMLAEPRDQPFSRSGWLFEPKLDGWRVLAAREGERVRLLTRNRKDLALAFPEVTRAVGTLPFERLILDGELVVRDDDGRPSFPRLQRRGWLERAPDVRRAAAETPATLYLFDALALDGRDLRSLPLTARRELLALLVPGVGALALTQAFPDDGERVFEEARRLGFEGVVGKRADAPYRAGRSADWVKVKAERTEEFVVVGFTRPQGSRTGFGALHLAAAADDGLVYAGRVGTGFNDAELARVAADLEKTRREDAPCRGAPRERGSTWVEPRLVCEVRFNSWTEDGLLRQPVFLRFREDRAPPAAPRVEPPPEVKLSNLEKVFWPDEGWTKGDLIAYYRAVAPWLVPWLRDRPVVLTRFPDGIQGKSFFQKDAPDHAPGWVRTKRLWSERTQREIDYFVCDDEAGLTYLANLATIPLHIWASRVAALDRPDWCVLDLDPKEAPFRDVVTLARAAHELCEELELPSFVKTSGSTGLHVLIPLGAKHGYDEARSFAELLARVLVAEHPEIATVTRLPEKRGGKVYLDFVQNGPGRLIVSPFCVRPLPGAPVSTPLEWKEVNARLDPKRFTIRTVPARLKKKGDPNAAVLELAADLPGALERLGTRKGVRTLFRGEKGS
jgi:bifunctional non-homologous end joining protein LigD